ncbi:cellulose binding domain-containing protein [Sphaerisporangium aureirubrum]|uniref:Cellulose binding domain-containing protein n=1 Tax=Sphaerisporangium aureirubrum TaxID=1544736 RepID=A0ABW1NX86_9ACTN
MIDRVLSRPLRGLLVFLCVAALVAAGTAWRAYAVPDTSAPVTGNSTYFDALGSPYGGCGLPQAQLDSPHFVALNVYNTPGDYAFYPRPIPPAQAARIGLWDNGRNCGRFVRVSIGDFCTGVNDGAAGQAFCRNGSWVSDAYNGATLTMIVADSCGDPNGWCRDDPYHLDLAKNSINQFVRNGAPVGDLLPNHYNNRRVTWSFVPAPDYTGDIRIGFMQGAQRYWPAIAVSHLANGIHGVEYFAGGTWQPAQMNSDMGQSFIIAPLVTAGTDYRIRVRDVTDALINGGREYSFSLPTSCGTQCSAAYTAATYTTSGGGTASPTVTVTPTVTPTVSPTPTLTPTPTATPTPTTGAQCRVTYAANDWGGGFSATLTFTNTGTIPINSWTLRFAFPGNQRVGQGWSATWSQSGAQVTATNLSWNGSLPPGGSLQIGFNGTYTGTNARPTSYTLNGVACALA